MSRVKFNPNNQSCFYCFQLIVQYLYLQSILGLHLWLGIWYSAEQLALDKLQLIYIWFTVGFGKNWRSSETRCTQSKIPSRIRFCIFFPPKRWVFITLTLSFRKLLFITTCLSDNPRRETYCVLPLLFTCLVLNVEIIKFTLIDFLKISPVL